MSLGRLLHWKGFDLGLKAFARAVASGEPALDGAEFWVLGDGPERERLAALADALGVADRVTLWGSLPRDECFRLLGRSHVLVHPSFHDSGGYATLEGMAAGRPVVCLDLGGPALQVTPQTGVVVPARAPEQAEADLADALVRLAADPDLRLRMGRAGRARVARRYPLSALVDYTLAGYDRIWAEESAHPPAPTLATPTPPADALRPSDASHPDADAVRQPAATWT